MEYNATKSIQCCTCQHAAELSFSDQFLRGEQEIFGGYFCFCKQINNVMPTDVEHECVYFNEKAQNQ